MQYRYSKKILVALNNKNKWLPSFIKSFENSSLIYYWVTHEAVSADSNVPLCARGRDFSWLTQALTLDNKCHVFSFYSQGCLLNSFTSLLSRVSYHKFFLTPHLTDQINIPCRPIFHWQTKHFLNKGLLWLKNFKFTFCAIKWLHKHGLFCKIFLFTLYSTGTAHGM